MSEQLLYLVFAAAGSPIQTTRDMVLDAVLEIISLQSEAEWLRGQVARLEGELALADKLGDAFAERYAALHERYRELADLLAPLIGEPPTETSLIQ